MTAGLDRQTALEDPVDDVEARIAAYLADEVGLTDLGPDAPLGEGGVDSAQVLELVAFVEDAFDLVLEPADIDLRNFESVAKVAALVRRRRG